MIIAVGFKSRVDKNTWNGSSRRSLEAEIANKRYMLHNIPDLDNWCKKAGVSTNLLNRQRWLLDVMQVLNRDEANE